MQLIEEIERNWSMSKYYIITLIADLISSLVITYFTFMLYDLPREYFWTIIAIASKPYFTTSFFLIQRTQKAKMINIITKLLDEALKIRDTAEWQVELAAVKPESLDRIHESLKNVTVWNASNDKIAMLEKIKELENKINILEQKQPKVVT